MEKKSKAKAEMLKELSREMSDDMYSPMKDMLKHKGMKKVSVMSDSPEGLKKGLSMAEKLMKLKKEQNGESEENYGDSENSMENLSDDMEENMGESEESKEDMKEDLSEMSEDDMLDLYEMLKSKLGK